MKPKEILELVRAGYTKEEIAAMNEDEPKEEPAEEKPVEGEGDPEEVQEEKNEKEDMKVDELLKAFKELRDDLKKRSVIADDYEVKDPQQKAQEILASIINPLDKNKK